MAKEIGPREKALREMREQRFEQAKAASREVGALREKVAAIPVRKAKDAKPKRKREGKL